MNEQATDIGDAVRIMRGGSEERDNRRIALDFAVRWHTASGSVIKDEVLLTTAEEMRKFLAGEE